MSDVYIVTTTMSSDDNTTHIQEAMGQKGKAVCMLLKVFDADIPQHNQDHR